MTGAVTWLRRNLFDTVWNGLLTVVVAVGAAFLVRSIGSWALGTARWHVVPDTMRLIAVGPYPVDEVWRIWTALWIVVALTGFTVGALARVQRSGRIAASLPVLAALLAIPWLRTESWTFLLATTVSLPLGLWIGDRLRRFRVALVPAWAITVVAVTSLLAAVPTNLWGGLFLTLAMTVVALAFAFPIGIALAVARVSPMPVVRILATAFVEALRGVPLVAVLFLAWLMVPLFVPEAWRTPQVVRAIVGFALFNAAYISEYVRGGLQGVPAGQSEGARALGLNGFDIMARIVLPQAIRSVVPGLVGQSITAFKNTSLVVIIGLLDLLGIAQSILGNPRFLGLERELYLFLMVLYFAIASLMSWVGRRIEVRMGLGTR